MRAAVESYLNALPDPGNKCPSCGFIFDYKPAYRRKCPSCKNWINIRNEKLVTQDQADRINAEWKKIRAEESIENDIDKFGISKDEYHRALSTKKSDGSSPSHAETVYSLAWDKCAKGKGCGFYSLALFARDNGFDFMPARIAASREELLRYQGDEFINSVTILSCGDDSCSACRKMDGKSFSIKDALRLMPLPVKTCSNKEQDHFCRCSYSPEVGE